MHTGTHAIGKPLKKTLTLLFCTQRFYKYPLFVQTEKIYKMRIKLLPRILPILGKNSVPKGGASGNVV